MNTVKVVALSVVLAITFNSAALAQDTVEPLATAYRVYSADGVRLDGAMEIHTMAMLMPSEEAAETTFPHLREIVQTRFLEETSDDVSLVTPIAEVSAPDFGDQSEAYTTTVERDGLDAVMVVVFIQQGRVLHAIMGAGLSDPSADVFAAASGDLGSDADPNDDDSMLALLPDLDDMPDGFAHDEESDSVERTESAAQ